MDKKPSASLQLKTALPALRKLYRRLEKQVSDSEPKLDRLQILSLILLLESSRRTETDAPPLGARSAPSPQHASLAVGPAGYSLAARRIRLKELINSVDSSLDGSAKTSWQAASSWLQAGERKDLDDLIAAISSELQKHHELLSPFDECFAGYFYQFSCEAERRLALDRIQSADKKTPRDDLIFFTQLYTPPWVGEYLAAQTILPQWCNLDTSSAQFEYARVANQYAKPGQTKLSASELRVLDPACGAGHLLLSAFDLLHEMHLLEGKTPEDSARHILNFNLAGCDLDSNALWVSGFALVTKASKYCKENPGFKLQLFDVSNQAEFEPGSLERKWIAPHALSKKYHAVISNPPYIGRRLLDRRLKQYLKTQYPSAHHDISAAFLVRALELCQPSGKVGFITQSSLLYLPSYGELRKSFINNGNLDSVVELGTRVFPLAAGEKINSMLIVLSNQDSPTKEFRPSFLDLSCSAEKSADLKLQLQVEGSKLVRRNCNEFLDNREYSFNYKCPSILSRILKDCDKIGDTIEIRQGLATSDNDRFVRYFWDVRESEIGTRWHPYVKGAGSERWHAACQTVVDWGGDGSKIKAAVEENYPYLKGRVAWVVKNEQYYFRKGLTFSFVSSGQFAVRRLAKGSIFDVGGSAVFTQDKDESVYLAYLNSSFVAACVQLLNPTINYQVGDLKQLPLPGFSSELKSRLKELADEAYQLKSALNAFDETHIAYSPSPQIVSTLESADPSKQWQSVKLLQERSCSRLSEIENEIDTLILSAIKETYSCSSAQMKDLKRLTDEKESARKCAQPYFKDESEFAAAILRHFVEEQFKNGAGCFFSVMLSDPFEGLINSQSRAWLEKQLSAPLHKYLIEEFNQRQATLFRGSPKLIVFSKQSADRILLVSNPQTREFLQNGVDKLQYDEYGYKVIKQAKERLLGRNDWTGKDLLHALK